MSNIQNLICNELESRFAWCIAGRDAPGPISMQEAADQIGDRALIDALLTNSPIRRCKYCGRLFVAHDIRERYCNKKHASGKTCKDLGAAKTRKEDPITFAFDAARRLHLWRRQAAGKTDAACKKYEAWCRFAEKQERLCRAGEISIEEMKALIGREYTKDKVKR